MIRLLLAAPLLFVAGTALSEPVRTGPVLAAASRFGQTERADLLEVAAQNGISTLRDEIYWGRVEQAPGHFVFDQPMTTWPDPVGQHGGTASLIINHRHNAHDGGDTPHSESAMQAQAAFAAAALARFPAIRAVEIGNEVNSDSFLTGPVRAAGLKDRAAYHVAQLAAVRAAARAQDPTVRVLGGGVHSIPVGYLSHIAQLGGAAQMDALALHPYDTPPEHFPAQIAVLRRMLPEFADMPVEVTEFGLNDAAAAPGYLLRYYCKMALAGVAQAVWYPLADRGDGLAPLFTSQGEITPVGGSFKLIQRELQGLPVRDVSPDVATPACLFGEDRLVIWGEPRALELAPGQVAFTPDGVPEFATSLTLSQDAPYLIRSTGGPLDIADIGFGQQHLLADSFFGYGYPLGNEIRTPGDGFERFARRGSEVLPLVTLPGQERGGVPWVPYRAARTDGGVRMLPDILIPAGHGGAPVEIVHAFEAPEGMRVEIDAMLAPSARSVDGVRLDIHLDGQSLLGEVVTEVRAITLGPLEMKTGQRLELVVGPHGERDGDDSRYRFRIRHVPG